MSDDAETPKICRHGLLRRQCETCDLADDLTAAEAERDTAVEWIGCVRDELAIAGCPPGDRTVALANLRQVLAERDALRARVAELTAIAGMLDAVVQGAQEEFVRVPYGASHEDVAQINNWHSMAKEARAILAAKEPKP